MVSRRPTQREKIEANQRARKMAAVRDTSATMAPDAEDCDWTALFPDLNDAPPAMREPAALGVWSPRHVGNVVEWSRNPETTPLESCMWADLDCIPSKGTRKRVLFLGESVARGFFFDPYYCPAQCLERMLTDAEVVDLSRNDIGLAGLRDLAYAGASLQPDAYVVFAGNNWVGFNSVARRSLQEVAPALARTRGVAELKRFLEGWLVRQTSRFLHQLDELSQQTGAPAVFVLPEFNLGDFKVDSRKSPPRFPDPANTERWFQIYQEGNRLLAEEEWLSAAKCAHELIALDGGTTAASFSLLSKCRAACGDQAGSLRDLERARDAEIWSPFATPRCFGVIQTTVRELAPKLGIHVIDVPRLLRRKLGNTTPDRRVFYDYCHLNASGLRSVLSAVAVPLQHCLAGVSESELEISTRFPVPAPFVSARASFLAAIHNATWGQEMKLVRHHLTAAKQADPSIARYAEIWTGAAGRKLHPFFTKAFVAGRELQDRLFSYRLLAAGPFAFTELTDEMASVFGDTVAAQVRETRQRWHDVGTQEIDLLETYYSAGAWDDLQARAAGRTMGYYAYLPQSRFVLFNRQGVPVKFVMHARAPGLPGRQVTVSIEGKRVACADAGTDIALEFVVGPAQPREGGCEIVVEWPNRPQDEGAFLFFEAFGKINRFSASRAG
jgi:hypothetical protein